jgi:large subunit ribosomal protein L10
MALTKDKKRAIADKLDSLVADAKSIVFVHAKGLPVQDTQAMRATLRENGVSYYVAKKTLIGRVLDAKGFSGEKPVCGAELSLACGTDLVAPAREVQGFVKSTKGKVAILGGVFEGRYMSAEEMTEIATIPSLHTLHAQFVNLVNSPIQRFVTVLSRIAEKKEA